MTTTEIIRRCIDCCASYTDGRGSWQAERECAESLAMPMMGNERIAAETAAAARRIGVWLRTAAA